MAFRNGQELLTLTRPRLILASVEKLELGVLSRRRPLSLLWVQIRSKLMPGDDTTGGALDSQDTLGGDTAPLIDGRPGDAQDVGQAGHAADDLGSVSDGFNFQGGVIHAPMGNSQLPLPSTNNYGAEGKEPLHIVTMDKDSLGSRLRKSREAAKLTQTTIAREFGITRNAVSLWESDVNAPTTDKIGRIADMTNVSVEYLLTGRQTKTVQKHEIPNPLNLPRDVPVLGTGACGQDGAFVFESTPIDWVKRPERIKGLPDVYALYVQGSSMAPWREEGQLVYVNPKQRPQIMDYVVVQTGTGGKPTAAYIKRLVKRSATEIRLRQYGPHPEDLVIPMRKVISIHRIIDWSELMAV